MQKTTALGLPAMRTIIAGSRTIQDRKLIYAILNRIHSTQWRISVDLCGMAEGVDLIGRDWAIDHRVTYEEYPVRELARGHAKWGVLAKIRNIRMALRAEALVAIWDGHSSGTGHMIDQARRRKLRIHVEEV